MNEAKREVVMPTSKQPGQVAHEAVPNACPWDYVGPYQRATYARVESAVRADERAKIEAELKAGRRDKERLLEALKVARHSLTCSHGLMAYDDATEASRKEHFRFDNTEELAIIDAALALPQPVAAILDKAQDPEGGEQ